MLRMSSCLRLYEQSLALVPLPQYHSIVANGVAAVSFFLLFWTGRRGISGADKQVKLVMVKRGKEFMPIPSYFFPFILIYVILMLSVDLDF